MGDGKVSATLSSPPSPPIPKLRDYSLTLNSILRCHSQLPSLNPGRAQIPAITSTVLAAPLASPLPRLPLVTRVALLADLLCIVSVVSLSAPNANCNKQTRDATILSFCSSIAFLFLPSVQRVAMAISPSGINPAVGSKLSPGSPESLTLANWICCISDDALHFCVLFSSNNSYYLGAELLRFDYLIGESVLKHLWHHQDAILCCSLKSVPVFIFANQAGLDMLETTLVALQDITWVFRGRQRKLEDTFQKNSNRLKLLGRSNIQFFYGFDL
ncbi:hypothetical protein Ahy_A09g043203 [Arachis hypogaea]|uniref:MEKHLA domain-containing protein n=1 Tax=Arachis hypogaea TaxID=3818 RepID=A0A445BHS9_ARAHY|nr:hypothetical protein Ahy_A09g043203 [Arachis hypogaea]